MERLMPVSNGAVSWTSVGSVPAPAKNLTLCGDSLGNSHYYLYDNERAFATLDSRYLWYLAIYTVEGSAKPLVTYWAGAPQGVGRSKTDLCTIEGTLQFASEPLIGGDCASMRACEKIVNGQRTCVSWDRVAWAPYLAKALLICGAGATGGAIGARIKKKRVARYAFGGFLGSAAAVGVLYAMGAMRPKYICEEGK